MKKVRIWWRSNIDRDWTIQYSSNSKN